MIFHHPCCVKHQFAYSIEEGSGFAKAVYDVDVDEDARLDTEFRLRQHSL